MANQIRYQVKYDIQKNSLNELKSSLQQIQKLKISDIMKIDDTDLSSAQKKLQAIQQDASKVEKAFNKAFNTKLNTLNIEKFNKELASSNLSIEKIHQSFSGLGATGQAAFNRLSTEILNTNVQLRQSNKLLDSLATSMANTIKWGFTSSIFNNMTRSIQSAYYYAKDLDRSLTNIRIVTGDSASQMEKFAQSANSAAKNLGKSTLDYSKTALSFYQQGLSDQQVAARTSSTLKAENITGIGSEMADYLTAVWNGFNVGAQDAELYVDKLAAVADSTASDMGELAIAMSKVASAAGNIGVDVDQLNGQIATVIATTRQAPESVGVAFKTIYARINDIKTGAEDAQVSLGNYSGKMAELGFNVLDASGHLRDTGEVIEEIGGRWQDLTREQQINLAQTMAGQRQYNNLIALFDNWDKYLQSVNTSMNAQGTLNEKNDRYLESLEAHMQQLGTQAERTYDILFDEKAVKSWVDALNGGLTIFNDFISGLGGGANAFAYFGTTVASIFNKQIAQGIQGVGAEIQRVLANIDAFNTKSKVIEKIKSGLQVQYAGGETTLGNTALTAQAEAAQKTLAVQKGLTAEQQKQAVQIQKKIGLTQQRISELQKQAQIRKQAVADALKETSITNTNKFALQDKYNYQQKITEQYSVALQVLNQTEQAIERGNLSSKQKNVLEEQLKQHLYDIKQLYKQQKGDAEGFNVAFQGMLNQIKSGKLDLKDWHQIEDIIRKGFEEEESKLNSIDYLIKNIGKDTSNLTEESRKDLEILQQQNDALAEQGRKTLNLQTLVKGVSTAGMALTSIGGGLSTALAEGATAADKLNGSFTAINGTVGALLTMIPGIGPALNIVWQGVSSIGKAILQATGIWDKFEDGLKSSKEKIAQLNEAMTKVGQIDKTKSQQISNLEALKEEYADLADKAGLYGSTINNLTDQEKQRYWEITDQFIQYNSAVIAGYDEQGHAIVRGQDALKDTIQILRQAKLEAERAALGGKDNILNGIEARHSNKNADEISAVDRDIERIQNRIRQEGLNIRTLEANGSDLNAFIDYLNNLYNNNPELAKAIDNMHVTLDGVEYEVADAISKFYRDINNGYGIKTQDQFLNVLDIAGQIKEQLQSQNFDLGNVGDTLFADFNSELYNELLDELQQAYKDKSDLQKDAQERIDKYTEQDAKSFIKALELEENKLYTEVTEGFKEIGLNDIDLYAILTDYITSQDDTVDKNEIYNAILLQAEDLQDILIQYKNALVTAQDGAAKDVAQQLKSDDQSFSSIHQLIFKSIQENFLNNKDIQNILKEQNGSQLITQLIKNLYNVDNVVIEDGVLKSVETAGSKAAQELKNSFLEGWSNNLISSGVLKGKKDDSTAFDAFLSQYTEDQIIALNNAFKDLPKLEQEAYINNFDKFKEWAQNYFKELDDISFNENLLKNFDKILKIIDKIQNGKDISYKDKLSLKQVFGDLINDKDLQNTANILEKVEESIFGMEQGLERYQGLSKLITDFETLDKYKDKLSDSEKEGLWQDIFDSELKALNMEQGQLEIWARNRGMIVDGSQKHLQEALNARKIEKQGESLQQLAQSIKNSGDTVDESSEDFIKLQDELQKITGGQWSADRVVSMIDEIAAYTDDGITKFQTYKQLLDYISNNAGSVQKLSAADQYKKDKDNLTTLQGASKALENKDQLTSQQSAAIGEILLFNQQLAAIAEKQGIDSEEFLEELNKIIEAKQEQLRISREIALEQNLKAIKQAEARKNFALSVGQFDKALEYEQQRKDLVAERVLLLQQVEDKDLPKFDEDIDTQSLEHLSETIQQVATNSKELSPLLAENKEMADELAQEILRFDDACQDVVKNYDNWMAALESGSLQDQVEAMDGLRDAYADLLDLDGDLLSQNFLSSAENLDLMRAAIDGDIDAYNQLAQAAQQDMQATLGITFNDTDFWNKKSEVEAAMDEMNFEELEIGANLDTGNFLQQLTDMVNAAHMTQEEATDYLSSMGINAKVIENKTEGQEEKQTTGFDTQFTEVTAPYSFPYMIGGLGMGIPQMPQEATGTFVSQTVDYVPKKPDVVVDKKENSAFSLEVESAGKKSGGGFKYSQSKNGGGSGGRARRSSPSRSGGGGRGGGGGSRGKAPTPDKSQKDPKKIMKDTRDIYHDINVELGQIDRKLSRVQKKQDALYGKQLLDNLNKQQKLLEKHKETLKEKQAIQQQDLKSQQDSLKNLDVTFDKYGNITNYMDILGRRQSEINAKTKEYNSLIDAYNTSTDQDIKKQIAEKAEALNKQIKNMQDEYKDLEDKIKRYDGLREDMEEVADNIEQETQKQIEIEIKKFRMNIEIKLDMGEAQRDWNQFRREVLEHTDILKDSNFSGISRDSTQNLRDIRSYFNINGSRGSLQTLIDQLLDTRQQIENINKLGNSAIYGDNKAQAMKHLQQDLKELMSQMEDVQSLIDNIDEAYLDTVEDITDQFDKQIDDYNFIGDLIEHNMDLLSLLYGDNNYDAMNKYYSALQENNLKTLDSLKKQRDFWKQQWDEAVQRGDTQAAKRFEENYRNTLSNLNQTIEDAASNLQNKYTNAINKIFDELDKRISKGKGTDFLSDDWELMNKNADEYLDTINAAFGIQQTERKYNQALKEAKSIKNQQALKQLMDEQLNILENKEKVTQYDIDRAEKLLQIEQARIALEQARSSKTSMRLKRDAQGNYSYEYTADDASVDDAAANLANAQNDLYNFDKERYKSNLNDMISAWQEFKEKYIQIVLDVNLTEEERIAKKAQLEEAYGEYINGKTEQNYSIRDNLMQSAFASMAEMYRIDVENYNQMSNDEKNILMNDLVPAWDSGIQQMTDKFAGEGGFIPTCEQAFDNIIDVTKDYQNELDQMASTADINLSQVKAGVDDTSDSMSDLIVNNSELISQMYDELSAISLIKAEAHALIMEYQGVYDAARLAISGINSFMQAQQRQAMGETQESGISGGGSGDSGGNSGSNNSNTSNSPSSNSSNNSKSGTKNANKNVEQPDEDLIEGIAGNIWVYETWGNDPYRHDNIIAKFGKERGEKIYRAVQAKFNSGYGYNGGLQHNWEYYKKYSLSSFRSGGYTGSWAGNEGRIGVLHQKQMVLNSQDTSNLLNTVSILRSVMSSLGGTVNARMSDFKSAVRNTLVNGNNSLEQAVHIEASFPNVNSKREIEEALSELVNLAAQRAMRR